MNEDRYNKNVNDPDIRKGMDLIGETLKELVGDEMMERMRKRHSEYIKAGVLSIPIEEGVSASVVVHGGNLMDYMYGSVSVVLELMQVDMYPEMKAVIAQSIAETIIDMANISGAADQMFAAMKMAESIDEGGMNIN